MHEQAIQNLEMGGEIIKYPTQCGLATTLAWLFIFFIQECQSHFLFPKQPEYMNQHNDCILQSNQVSVDGYLIWIQPISSRLTSHEASTGFAHQACQLVPITETVPLVRTDTQSCFSTFTSATAWKTRTSWYLPWFSPQHLKSCHVVLVHAHLTCVHLAHQNVVSA